MNLVENKTLDMERALYGSDGIVLKHCAFDGPADGESALKESRNMEVENCFFNLRYPFWHDDGLNITGSEMTELCRAALWYSTHVTITDSKLHGIKALRECSQVSLRDCDVISAEFGWSVHNMEMMNCTVQSEYFMMRSDHLAFRNVRLKGKYSFQYIHDATFDGCTFDTKDAFWHAKDVVVRALQNHRNPAPVLLQRPAAGGLRNDRHRPELRKVPGGSHHHNPRDQHQKSPVRPYHRTGRGRTHPRRPPRPGGGGDPRPLPLVAITLDPYGPCRAGNVPNIENGPVAKTN